MDFSLQKKMGGKQVYFSAVAKQSVLQGWVVLYVIVCVGVDWFYQKIKTKQHKLKAFKFCLTCHLYNFSCHYHHGGGVRVPVS